MDRKLSAEAVGPPADGRRGAALRRRPEWPRGTLVAVANAGVVLRGAGRLGRSGFAASADASSSASSPGGGRPLALVLSVTVAPSVRVGGRRPQSVRWRPVPRRALGLVSWGVPVFKMPISAAPSTGHCSRRRSQKTAWGWMLHRGGCELRNPCRDVAAERYHCATTALPLRRHCAAKAHAKPALRTALPFEKGAPLRLPGATGGGGITGSASGCGGRSGNRSRGRVV